LFRRSEFSGLQRQAQFTGLFEAAVFTAGEAIAQKNYTKNEFFSSIYISAFIYLFY